MGGGYKVVTIGSSLHIFEGVDTFNPIFLFDIGWDFQHARTFVTMITPMQN
jgi:hypothetical protein